MKTLFPKILLGLLGAALVSCEDEEDKITAPEQMVIQFEGEQQSIREDDNSEITLTLVLSPVAASDGKVNLKVKDEAWQRLQTNPEHVKGTLELPVVKGASQLQFTIKAVNNSVNDGDVTAEISIEPSPAFIPGERNTFQLIIQDDDDPAPVQSIANFMEQVETVAENSRETIEYKIRLSSPAAIDSKIVIHVASGNAEVFVTSPAPENEKITLIAPAGTTELSFTLNTINNEELTGHAEVVFSIFSTEGSIIKGTQLSRKITISDDELAGKLKGYEIGGAQDAVKRFYEYDSKGRIAKVTWETYTPYKRSGTETYFYDAQDRIVKINKYPGRDVHFLWNNNRIERSEVYQDGNLIEYANYAYDQQGNVAGAEPYHRQSDGAFKRGLFVIYLYFNDGNIYKAMMYTDVPGKDEPVLLSTRTYDHYLATSTPVPMLEILPGVRSQKNLAGRYRVEENGFDFNYTLTYEFRPDGLPSKRKATSSNDTQTVLYHYY